MIALPRIADPSTPLAVVVGAVFAARVLDEHDRTLDAPALHRLGGRVLANRCLAGAVIAALAEGGPVHPSILARLPEIVAAIKVAPHGRLGIPIGA